MKRSLLAAVLVIGLVVGLVVASLSATALPAAAAPTPGVPGADAVDLSTGTGGGPPWFNGGTTPAATRPFGMVQLGPDTTSDVARGTPSRTASGYAADDTHVRGFSPTHLSGAGCPAFGDVPVLPWTGRLPADPGAAVTPRVPASERSAPGWYRTRLGNGVTTTLTAADRSGLATFRFPQGAARPRLLVKGAGSLAGTSRVQVRFPSRREVLVRATSGRFCGSPATYDVHVRLRFDRPVSARRTWRDGSGPAGAWVGFDLARGRTVRAQVAVSFVGAAGTRRNLEADRVGWSPADLRRRGTTVWDRELGRVRASGGTRVERTTLRTALYHSLLHPTTLSDADGRYPGFDGRVHRAPGGHRRYTALAGWDAYRTHLPLLAWLRPDVASDVVRSLLAAGQEGGHLPRWALVAADTGVMEGDSAAPMVAAAWAFGARDVDLPAVVDRLLRQATVPGPARPDLAAYLERGYVPAKASTTLEYVVDDFALSRLAVAVGRDGDAVELRERSRGWRRLLDPDRSLLAPRDAAGAFPGPGWDPAACCAGYQEGTGLQYAWSVPHDVAGLLAEVGSPDEARSRLDDLHTELNAGAGRHAWLGNQPSLLTPWVHHWLGEPARTQDVVARALGQLWRPGPTGIPGNDDLGGLSAWYVWAALGLQPLVPGTADVALGRPVPDLVVVSPLGGPPTRIVREGRGRHVASVLVDGRDRPQSWVSFDPATRPRTITVSTTDTPSPAWGTAAEDRPPSYP